MPSQNPAQRLESQLQKYPGMLVDETVVWRAWALMHESEYDRFDHNIRLGPGSDPGPAFLPSVRKSEILNSQMRVDSIGWQGVDNSMLPGEISSPAQVYDVFPSAVATIFEVKRRATLQAVGEILGHFHAWVNDWPNNPHPALCLVCASYASTILPVTRGQNVKVDVVQANFSILSTPHGT